ncbi:flagellar motor switch protein FliN [Burkholderia anthina]|uniref:Flagellar motor switch protein FliN n=1 Tax=Burkholderia anthina TaxID=179879 RepID=A0A6P2GBK0_9BURK|nr:MULTISPECIES: flagellar motor switch protein FliN [Burkholderia]AXK64003.1 flagellar motor switch protein FliN [Burkholderia sp. IDO3]MBM2770765.1 flagellar motor switch protein FliN [Burkholderia anthina]MBY4869238.1 flagellar motor switch protein FliN [Burkholderia anthina]MCA8093042.1 flagellar motor switch protein FliN [Burkholderia anthina]PCD59505.1 flagellar motor switch protein FliN [Burkholderia sp. IDO3]
MSELNQTPDLDPQALADAALAESAAAAQADPGMDDWAAALAEQNQQPVQAGATGAGVFQPLSKAAPSSTHNDIEMILDIPVKMTVELGRTKIAIRNLLQLAQGSVVELDGLAGEPMDVLVNGCLIAQGEVVVVNDKFGIRLTDIITPAERIRKLNR